MGRPGLAGTERLEGSLGSCSHRADDLAGNTKQDHHDAPEKCLRSHVNTSLW